MVGLTDQSLQHWVLPAATHGDKAPTKKRGPKYGPPLATDSIEVNYFGL